MKISIGADHGAYELKNELTKYLIEQNYEVKDFGCYDCNAVDYPLVAKEVATTVSNEEADFGIVLCTSGIGVSMSANKVKGIRAALCVDLHGAEMTRRHNNANVLCMGATYVSAETAKQIIKVFLHTEFEGGRHQRRVDLMMEIERGNEND